MPDLTIDELIDTLHRIGERGLPYAARNALNAAAFEGRRVWKREVAERMTLRNTWTERSLRVWKARGRNVETMRATLGSVAPYMVTQETGGTLQQRGRQGVPIPTSVASGEGRNARPRKRRVRKPNRLASIALTRRTRGRHRRQRNAVAIAMALHERRRFVFLEHTRGGGIFRIFGGRRRPRLELIWDLTRPSVRIPATRTLKRTVERLVPQMPRFVGEAVVGQLLRYGFRRG